MASRILHKKDEAGMGMSGGGSDKTALRQKRLALVLSNVAGRKPSKEIRPLPDHYKRDNEIFDLTGGLVPEAPDQPPFPAPSSLAIYFKSISKYPLLNEEQEKSLARLIKHYEKEFNLLVVKWCVLLRRKFLELFPLKQHREILAVLRREHSFIPLFDDIERLLKERRKIKSLLEGAKGSQDVKNELKESENSLEAEISKCIAKIKIDEALLGKLVQDIESLSYRQSVFKKRKQVELEMKKTLREIESVTAEIKNMKNQMVNANLRLVISIAKKYLNQGVALADLIQEGNLGLMRAIDTYDYVRGHRLVTYATWWIKQAMIRAIDCQSKTVRTPVYVTEKLNQIMKTANRLYQEWKREPTLDEIADATKTPLHALERVLTSSKDYIPLEYMVEDQSEGVVDAAEDFSCGSIPAQVAADHLSQVINNLVLSDLTDRERDIIKLRFGIGNAHDHTLEEIGREFNLSRERIRQILETALRKMRTPEQLTILREFAGAN